MTGAQFREGVAAYRAAGYRLILYTSVMASGMNPEFQSGRLCEIIPIGCNEIPRAIRSWSMACRGFVPAPRRANSTGLRPAPRPRISAGWKVA